MILRTAYALLGYLVLAGRVFAQSGGGTQVPLTNPLGATTNFMAVMGKIVTAVTTIAAPIVAIMVVVGGFQIIVAGGNPEKVSNGKKTILYAAVGFAVILIADSVALIIENFLTTP